MKKMGMNDNDSFFRRLIRGLYARIVNEPYFPKGKIEFVITLKSENIHRSKNSIRINYKPKEFVKGQLEDYFFDDDDTKIIILK
jgi:hypothetical protein